MAGLPSPVRSMRPNAGSFELHELGREGQERIVQCGLDSVAMAVPQELEPRINLSAPDLREDGGRHGNFALRSVAAQKVDGDAADDDPDPMQGAGASVVHDVGRRAWSGDQHFDVRPLPKLDFGEAHRGRPPELPIDVAVRRFSGTLRPPVKRRAHRRNARCSSLRPSKLGKLALGRSPGAAKRSDMLTERGWVDGELRIRRRGLGGERFKLRRERGPFGLVERALRGHDEGIRQ